MEVENLLDIRNIVFTEVVMNDREKQTEKITTILNCKLLFALFFYRDKMYRRVPMPL